MDAIHDAQPRLEEKPRNPVARVGIAAFPPPRFNMGGVWDYNPGQEVIA